ncbi:MAG TPA: hypothetical protein VMU39_14205 [Solirubrobacteraceae bacterium]|nr:hypothetical protein [Solirubrobacteraceae bacterium]
MFRSRKRLGLASAVVVVLAASLLPAAGIAARGIQPTSPWYAYDAAIRKAEHHNLVSSVQPTSPWYAYDAALRKAQHERLVQAVQAKRAR